MENRVASELKVGLKGSCHVTALLQERAAQLTNCGAWRSPGPLNTMFVEDVLSLSRPPYAVPLFCPNI